MKNLKKTELVKLQTLNSDFVNLKTQLGDLELQKHLVVEKVQEVRSQFGKLEKELVEKYGENTTINLQTGELKEKEKE
jgi:predicted  nucleic acid-binding Zn-ribbon protein|tara:strand:- start:6788 stop:7021 length:234 start_codon:yes stop_codon:yes gene_type:complete